VMMVMVHSWRSQKLLQTCTQRIAQCSKWAEYFNNQHYVWLTQRKRAEKHKGTWTQFSTKYHTENRTQPAISGKRTTHEKYIKKYSSSVKVQYTDKWIKKGVGPSENKILDSMTYIAYI
jgi:hypothetical protein